MFQVLQTLFQKYTAIRIRIYPPALHDYSPATILNLHTSIFLVSPYQFGRNFTGFIYPILRLLGIFAREEELLPTFEGEPVEESSGWVQTADQGELYSGWEEAIEEAPEDEDTWEREESGEEAFRPGKKRKKKSGKSRFGRTHTRE